MGSLSSTSSSLENCSMKILEECLVSFPSPKPSYLLPLTFFDIPWLLFPPIQPLFFFQLPNCDDDDNNNNELEFNSTILPTLKNSLSSALAHFFPFASKITISNENPDELSFITDEKSSVKLTIVQSSAEFDQFCSYFSRENTIFHNLVPFLQPINKSSHPKSLFSIQITNFPNSNAFSIGFSYYPVLCDQRTFCNFVHTWACYSKFGEPKPWVPKTQTFDRSVILDSDGLLSLFMNQWLNSPCEALTNSLSNGGYRITSSTGHPKATISIKPINHVIRATFVMDPTAINNGKQWIEAQCDKLNKTYPVTLSPYVVTCALIWYCLIKARHNENDNKTSKGPMYFGFIAGGLTRVRYRVPSNYFGNCVGFGRAVADREELLKGDGILVAADAIAKTIKTLDNDLLGGADMWISDWETLIGSEDDLHIVGSPKVNLYETDFGWGRPKKIEEISIDANKGISLCESRDMKGGIEIGITLPNSQMKVFSTLFNRGLNHFSTRSSF